MKKTYKLTLASLLLVVLFSSILSYIGARELTVVTFNVWHGMRDKGILRLEEYESPQERERRYQLLVNEIVKLRPDVIVLQEANQLPYYAKRLSRDLGYDEIHQVANGGIKIGYFGIPLNIKEGLVILAKKGLNLEWVAAKKLSGGKFDVHTDFLTIHFQESRYALVGKVTVEGRSIYLFNVHLHHLSKSPADVKRRQSEVRAMLELADELADGKETTILAGDLNAPENSPEIRAILRQGGFLDTFRIANPKQPGYTWDPSENVNIRYQDEVDSKLQGGSRASGPKEVAPRRIDYIFVNRGFRGNVVRSRLVFNKIIDGVNISDHFGVLTAISLQSFE